MNEGKKELTVKEIFEKVARGIEKHPDAARNVGGVYQFRIGGENGGLYHLDLKNDLGVSLEEKPAECELEIRDRDFIKLYKGILPGFKAMLSGKLKVKGDLALAAKLSEIFSQTRHKD